MQKNMKAWLKVTYMRGTYLPVIILQRTNQLRSLIVDENGPIDRSLGYYVDDSLLLPRDDNNQHRNLFELEHVNLPELKKRLSQNQYKNKYLAVGNHLMIDIRPTAQNDGSRVDEQLEIFYKSHIQILLNNKKQKQKLVVIVSKQSANPHYYAHPLFQLLAKTTQMWPHKLKIEKLSVILKKMFSHVSMEIKLGFVQHKSNMKQSRKVTYVHLKPYIPICPTAGLSVPSQILSLGNTEKFSKMYKGPIPNYPQTPPSEIQMLVDAFLCLGVEVKTIHYIMKILSIILNLSKLTIIKQEEGPRQAKYTTYHLKNINDSKDYSAYGNINELLQLEPSQLQNLLIFGQNDSGGRSLRDRQKSEYLSNLGSKHEIAIYRLHLMKFIFYQILLLEVCKILNQKICTQDFAQEDILQDTQFENKTFMLFSYGVAVNNDLRTIPKQLQSCLFWNNGREILENKILDIVKSSIICSIIGTTTINSDKSKQKQSQTMDRAQKGYISRRKKHGELSNKSQMNMKILQNQIQYEQEIDDYIKAIKNPEVNGKLQYKQVPLLEKQLYIRKLYLQMSQYKLFTEISHRLLSGNDKMINKNIIEQIPYSMYEYIWVNYYKLQNFNSPTLSFQKDYLVITNSKEVASQEQFLQKLVDAIHMRKIKMNQGEQDQIGIQVKLDDFANRYLYTNFCKQKVHRVYPKPIQKYSKKSSKKLKISQATQYLDHSITTEELGQKIQNFLSKQFSPHLEMAKQNIYSKDSSKGLKVKDPQFLQNLQKQVQKQFVSAKRIQMQFFAHQNRKRTLQILDKIWRERKLQKILARLQGLFRKRAGFKQIIQYDYSKVKQEENRKKRLQELREGNSIAEQRERIRREREQKKAAAKARQQQKKRVEQLRQQRYKQHERLQQQKIEQRNKLKAQRQAAEAQKQKEQRQAARAQEQKQKHTGIQNIVNQPENIQKKQKKPDENQNKKQLLSQPKQHKAEAKIQSKTQEKQNESSNKEIKPLEKSQEQKQLKAEPEKSKQKPISQPKKKPGQTSENKQIKPQDDPTNSKISEQTQKKQSLTHNNIKEKQNDSSTQKKEEKLNEQKSKVDQKEPQKQQKVQDAPFILSSPYQKKEPNPTNLTNQRKNQKNTEKPKKQDQKKDSQQKKATRNEKSPENPKQKQDPEDKKIDPTQTKAEDKKNKPQQSKPSEPKVEEKKVDPEKKNPTQTKAEDNKKEPQDSKPSESKLQEKKVDPEKKNPTQTKVEDKKNEPQDSKPSESKLQEKKAQPQEKKIDKTRINQNSKQIEQDAPFILSDLNEKKDPINATKQQPKIVLTPPPKTEQPQKQNKQNIKQNKAPQTKKQNQFVDKSSQILQQLTKQQLLSIADNPIMTLEQWQKNCKIKFGQFNKKSGRQMFTKYASMTQRIPTKPYQYPKLIPNQQAVNKIFKNDYFSFTKQIINCNNDDKIQAKMLSNQKDQMSAPLLKAYPIDKYPTFFKEAFNAILKIGLEKNSSKKTHELLNVFTAPISKSYYEEFEKSKTQNQKQGLPSDYSSNHNALKDEVFLYFVKQITSQNPDKPPSIKNLNAYLFGMSVFTRYYCPSPNLINPLTSHINSIRKLAIQKNQNETYRNLLDSVYQNLLFFVQASECVKKNPLNLLLDQDKNKNNVVKGEVENSSYLQIRKSAIRQNQINKKQDDKKPQPITITLWLVNHEPFTFPVRNQIALTLKKKILTQIGYISRQQCFSLYFLQPNYTFTLIDQKEKVLNLIPLTQIYKQKKLRRPIYLRLAHYFPFILKDINTTRLAYLNMISEQITFPWKPEQYEFVVAQSMCYQDYEQIRIGNYLQFTNQAANQTPNMKPVEQKFKALIGQSKKKICEYEYMRYSKEMGFLLIKCFQMDDDPNYIIGIKPYQIVFYKDKNKFCSMAFKRIRNVYIQGSKIVLEVYYKNTLEKGKEQTKQRLRTHTIIQAKKPLQLFKSILFQLENRISQ